MSVILSKCEMKITYFDATFLKVLNTLVTLKVQQKYKVTDRITKAAFSFSTNEKTACVIYTICITQKQMLARHTSHEELQKQTH